jgi:hydroxymethylbilane synthase
MEKLIIATRASALALWQAEFVAKKIKTNFPNLEVKLKKITSKGDKILDRPLALVGGKGHFTKELEDEMLAGNAHLAVHSLKDVPTFIPKELELAAITKREDQSDVLLSFKYKSFEELPKGAVIGTTSLRRRMQILRKRPDLRVKDLRGNVNTRLKKLKDGEFDAIILAYIGLKRLNLLKEIPFVQKLEFMIPPMGQASLGIEIISNNEFLKKIALSLDDQDTHLCVDIERDFIAKIGAGCSAPVAVNASFDGDKVKIKAMLGFADGSKILYEEMESLRDESKDLGKRVAQKMIEYGALELLKEAEEMAFKDERAERL